MRDLDVGKYRVKLFINEHHLGPGVYYLNCAIKNNDTGEKYEQAKTNVCFSVTSANRFERGVVLVDEVWDFEKL